EGGGNGYRGMSQQGRLRSVGDPGRRRNEDVGTAEHLHRGEQQILGTVRYQNTRRRHLDPLRRIVEGRHPFAQGGDALHGGIVLASRVSLQGVNGSRQRRKRRLPKSESERREVLLSPLLDQLVRNEGARFPYWF